MGAFSILLLSIGRVEGGWDRLDISPEAHFLYQINVFEDAWYDYFLIWVIFQQGPTYQRQRYQHAKMVQINAFFTFYKILFVNLSLFVEVYLSILVPSQHVSSHGCLWLYTTLCWLVGLHVGWLVCLLVSNINLFWNSLSSFCISASAKANAN